MYLQTELAESGRELRAQLLILALQCHSTAVHMHDVLIHDQHLAGDQIVEDGAEDQSGDAPRSARPLSSSLAMPFARGSTA